jgi:hypothetical protein
LFNAEAVSLASSFATSFFLAAGSTDPPGPCVAVGIDVLKVVPRRLLAEDIVPWERLRPVGCSRFPTGSGLA